MKSHLTAIFISVCLLAVSCCDRIEPDPVTPPDDPTENPENPVQKPDWPDEQTGKAYIWDDQDIPEFHLIFSEKEWNNLLSGYDKNPDVTSFVKCAVVFEKRGIRDTLKSAGIRLYDNKDAMRPEGKNGSKHKKDGTEWHLSNYEIDFNRYIQSEEHTLRKVRSVYLKSCVNDPSYARERYCYNLFERFGIKTIGRNTFCRLNINIQGDEKPAYIGVYQMIEPIDESYLTDRAKLFGSSSGNLWKCRDGASLVPSNSSLNSGVDNGKGESYQYLLLTNKTSAVSATTQLDGFMKKLRSMKQDEFHTWIKSVCDIELLLRTYAVSVAVGMWDDYWNNGTNFYLYFNSTSSDDYKVYIIPFDYEMSLGNSRADIMTDPGTQDPYNWGKQANPLIMRILQYPDFYEIYRNALTELTLEDAYLMEPEISSAIISDYMYQASFYSGSETGINIGTKDRTAHWSNHQEYRISVPDKNNFFAIRSEAIRRYSE